MKKFLIFISLCLLLLPGAFALSLELNCDKEVAPGGDVTCAVTSDSNLIYPLGLEFSVLAPSFTEGTPFMQDKSPILFDKNKLNSQGQNVPAGLGDSFFVLIPIPLGGQENTLIASGAAPTRFIGEVKLKAPTIVGKHKVTLVAIQGATGTKGQYTPFSKIPVEFEVDVKQGGVLGQPPVAPIKVSLDCPFNSVNVGDTVSCKLALDTPREVGGFSALVASGSNVLSLSSSGPTITAAPSTNNQYTHSLTWKSNDPLAQNEVKNTGILGLLDFKASVVGQEEILLQELKLFDAQQNLLTLDPTHNRRDAVVSNQQIIVTSTASSKKCSLGETIVTNNCVCDGSLEDKNGICVQRSCSPSNLCPDEAICHNNLCLPESTPGYSNGVIHPGLILAMKVGGILLDDACYVEQTTGQLTGIPGLYEEKLFKDTTYGPQLLSYFTKVDYCDVGTATKPSSRVAKVSQMARLLKGYFASP